jgi:putative hydrolase of the HAD superfamily
MAVDGMNAGPFGAVVFDLYGTLVDEFRRDVFLEHVRAMAGDLGADPEAFERGWTATAIERQTGVHATVEENLRAVCAALDVVVADEGLARAIARRAAMYATSFRPRPGAEDTLRAVKERGYPTALVSVCAPDTPALWRATSLARWIDVEVFSSEVGLRKPEPEIFRYATDRLRVDPTACLYVGDGAYGEMRGAAAVGMTSVLIRDPDEEPGSALRPDAEEWDGASIEHLSQVLTILDGSAGWGRSRHPVPDTR